MRVCAKSSEEANFDSKPGRPATNLVYLCDECFCYTLKLRQPKNFLG